jgi:replicative DNA helicase
MSGWGSSAVEQAVLGALLIGGDWHEAAMLTAEDFQVQRHRDVFAAMAALAEDGAALDVVSVAERMDARGTLGEDGLGELGHLATAVPSRAVEPYVRMLRGYTAKRRAQAALRRAQEALVHDEDPARVLAEAQAAILADVPANASPIAQAVTAGIEASRAALARGGMPGAPTGVPFIDRRTGGMAPGRLWVIAGRPAAGKSAFALQAAAHAAAQGHGVAFVSLEMGAAELGIRAISQHLQMSATALTMGDARVLAEAEGSARLDTLRAIPMVVDTSTHRIAELSQRIALWSRAGTKVVIVDYLQRLGGGQGNTRNEQLGDITRRLKRLCLDLGMCVAIVSSLNRGSEREDRDPNLSDLRESGDIEYDADVVIGLRRVGLDDVPEYDVRVGILKNRSGRIGWCNEPFTFDARFQRFYERNSETYRGAA